MKARKKIMIAIVSFSVLSVLFLVGLLYPIFKGLVNDQQQVVEYELEIAQLEADLESVDEFSRIEKLYALELSQLDNLFVDSDFPVPFFRFLDDTAASLGVIIEKNPGTSQQLAENMWPSLDVRITGEGSYTNVMGFLQSLENAPYLIEVDTLSMSQKQNTESEITFALLMTVFTQ